jgi:hypothetical protein
MRFISIGNYLSENEREYWLVILKEWDKLKIPREEYLSIKWEMIHKEMVFETIELSWDFQDEIILGKWVRIINEYW